MEGYKKLVHCHILLILKPQNDASVLPEPVGAVKMTLPIVKLAFFDVYKTVSDLYKY
jgi:hypothetical protein